MKKGLHSEMYVNETEDVYMVPFMTNGQAVFVAIIFIDGMDDVCSGKMKLHMYKTAPVCHELCESEKTVKEVTGVEWEPKYVAADGAKANHTGVRNVFKECKHRYAGREVEGVPEGEQFCLCHVVYRRNNCDWVHKAFPRTLECPQELHRARQDQEDFGVQQGTQRNRRVPGPGLQILYQ